MRVSNGIALIGLAASSAVFGTMVWPQGRAMLPEVVAVVGMVLCAALWQREQVRSNADARVTHAEAQRLAAEEKLRHADRLIRVGQLAAGVAHEVGTPLNVARLHADMIASGEVETAEEVEASARSIIEQCDRVARQLRRLLTFARVRDDEEVHDLALAELLGGVQVLLSPVARKSGVAVAPLEGADRWVRGDGSQLQQVFLNLGINAIHAMPQGGTLRMALAQEGEEVVVAVHDTGAGMVPAVVARIFEPFYTTKPPGEGTGLGLSVCQGIVADHGGRIGVESVPGVGTTFRVWLPAAAAV